MSLKKIYLHNQVNQHNRTKEPCINDTPSPSPKPRRLLKSQDVGVKVADITVVGIARAFVSLPIMTCWQLMWLTKKWALSTLLCMCLHISSKWLSSGVRAGYY